MLVVSMSQSLFNLKFFSRSTNNIILMRRYILITQASRRAYAIGSSGEKPSWALDRDATYYRPEAVAKEFDQNIVTTSKSEVKTTRRGEELWWMPDPQTGFYRPDNCAREPDAVELRSVHLHVQKSKQTF